MANRNFNKQIVPARKKLAAGGPAGTGKGAPPFKGPRKPKPKTNEKYTKKRTKSMMDSTRAKSLGLK